MRHVADFQQYVEILREHGDLCAIDHEVDPYLEMAAFARRGYDQRVQAPAPLFTNIKGAKPGLRAIGAPFALSSIPGRPAARMALSLGLSFDATWAQIVEALVAARGRPGIPPKIVETAPCKQNILHGEAATLDIFPIGTLHAGDSGPYANTLGAIVVRSPCGKWTNWSIARVQKLDGKTMTGTFIPGQHNCMIWEMWVAINKPMPFAIVQGCEPGVPVVSGMFIGDWVSESDYLGAHFGEPIEVVRCETVELEVPASAEVVIEGHVSLVRDSVEGPFGEYQGYQSTEKGMQPTYHVESISYRDGAIWPFVPAGVPIDDTHTIAGISGAVEALGVLREAGLPVTMAWSPFETAISCMIVTVPSDWREKLPRTSSMEFAEQIAEIFWNSRAAKFFGSIYVIDDDIDPTDAKQLLWALATRCHPSGRQHVNLGLVLRFMTMYTQQEREAACGPRVVHDCLLPAPGQGRETIGSFEGAYPEEVRQRVLKQWRW